MKIYLSIYNFAHNNENHFGCAPTLPSRCNSWVLYLYRDGLTAMLL